MDPQTQNALHAELLIDEGKRLLVYDDATGLPLKKGMTLVGNPTIGIGRNLAGRGITDAEAEDLFSNDCAAAEADLLPLLPWIVGLTPNRQAVIYCLYFNLDEGNARGFIAAWPNFLLQMRTGQF